MPARPLEPPEMGQRSPVDFVSMIAREMARLHRLAVTNAGPPGKAEMWRLLPKWLKLAKGKQRQLLSMTPTGGESTTVVLVSYSTNAAVVLSGLALLDTMAYRAVRWSLVVRAATCLCGTKAAG